jgi:hypothetical protein
MFRNLPPDILKEILSNYSTLPDLAKLREAFLSSRQIKNHTTGPLHTLNSLVSLHIHFNHQNLDVAFITSQILRYFQYPESFFNHTNYAFFENSMMVVFLKMSTKDYLIEIYNQLGTQESKKNFLEELITHENPHLSQILIDFFMDNRLPQTHSLLIDNKLFNTINQFSEQDFNFFITCLNLPHHSEKDKLKIAQECSFLSSHKLFQIIIRHIFSNQTTRDFKIRFSMGLLNAFIDDTKCHYTLECLAQSPTIRSEVARNILSNNTHCNFSFLVGMPRQLRRIPHSPLYTKAHEICEELGYYGDEENSDETSFMTPDVEFERNEDGLFVGIVEPIESDLDAIAFFYDKLTRLQFMITNSVYPILQKEIFEEFYNQNILEEGLNPLQEQGLRPHPYEYTIAKALHYWYEMNPEFLRDKIDELVKIFMQLNLSENESNLFFGVSLLKILIAFKIRHPDFPIAYDKEICNKAYELMNYPFEDIEGVNVGIALLMKKYFSNHFMAYQIRTSNQISMLFNNQTYDFDMDRNPDELVIKIHPENSNKNFSFDDLLGALIYLIKTNHPNPMFILTQMTSVLMKMQNTRPLWIAPLIEEVFHAPFPSEHGLNLMSAILVHPYFNELSDDQKFHTIINVETRNYNLLTDPIFNFNFYEKVRQNMRANLVLMLINYMIERQLPISFRSKKSLLNYLLGNEIDFVPDEIIANFVFPQGHPIELNENNFYPLYFLSYLLRCNVDLGLHYAIYLKPRFMNLVDILNEYYQSEFSSNEDKIKINNFLMEHDLIGLDIQLENRSTRMGR